MRIKSFLKTSPMFALFTQGLEIQKVVKKSLKKYELNLLQSMVLCAVFFEGEDEAEISKISESLGVAKSNISHVVNHLETLKLIKRHQSTRDHRYWSIRLTTKAQKIMPDLVGYFDSAQNSLEKKQSLGEIKQALLLMEDTVEHHKAVVK